MAGVLLFYGRTENFKTAHAFGLFALVMDYALNYMNTGSRELSYPNMLVNLDKGYDSGDEPMGPVGVFLFFLWFDYAAFGLLLWALSAEHYFRLSIQKGFNDTVESLLKDKVDIFNLLIVPIQFWTAPVLASSLHIDSRTVILTRESSKFTYAVMLLVFTVLLRYANPISSKVKNFSFLTGVAPIILAGIGCGLIHHAALFTFGMRGYSDISSLAITLLTEWPALITGVAVIRLCGGSVCATLFSFMAIDSTSSKRRNTAIARSSFHEPGFGTTLFIAGLWVAFFSLLQPYLAAINDKDAMALLIPEIPGHYMQTVGTAFLRARTCLAPKYVPSALLEAAAPPPLNCWYVDRHGSNVSAHNDGRDFLVLASAAKSGAVLSARLAVEIGASCGVCVASGERSAPGIPGPVEDLPVYEGGLLHAIINMRTWPQYVERMGYSMNTLLPSTIDTVADQEVESGVVRCVTTLRDPLARLRSLYTYARSGGEHWFRYQSGIMQRLGDPSLSLQQSLDLFWELFGKGYLIQSHEYIMMNLQLGCVPVKMEQFSSNYTLATALVLKSFGIRDAVIPELTKRLSSGDLSLKSEAERKADAHFTANKFSSSLVEQVKVQLMLMPEVSSMVKLHRSQLGYR